MTTTSIRSSASASLSSVSTESEREDLVTYHVSKLTLSVDNTLIYFLHLKVGEGMFNFKINEATVFSKELSSYD